MLSAPTQEPLSLATFEPNRTYAPYLNTPRSLEACRIHGVNPVELVELPISEFQKDFPNDPDAAQRRFERIDGARRRLLAAVKTDWKRLCDTNWTPNPSRPKSAKEAILDVPVHSHCTLLEIQAEKFRKMEAENYKFLQHMLKMEMKKADAEVKGKQIVGKHEEIQENNDNLKKEREERKRIAVQEMLDRQQRKEEEFRREIKMLQEIDAEYSKKMAEEKSAKRLEEKQRRERCEMERKQRSEITKHMKDSIVNAIESKIENRKKTLELRDKSVEERMKETREMTIKQKSDRAKEVEDRLQKAKEEVYRREEEEKLLTIQKMKEHEEYRQKIIESRNSQRREQNSNSMKEHLDKIRKIREDSEKSLDEKAWRIKKEMEFKDELARQELGKVKEAQTKRRCIKSIKQESFEMSSMRARKAHEYKMAKLMKEIQDKDIRSNAIKKGFQVLNQMRNSMKDIVYSTKLILKEEMHRLRHKDDFRPDTVVDTALAVSKAALFPRLENVFGIEKPKEEEVTLTSSDIFSMDFNDSTALENAADFLKSSGEDPKAKTAESQPQRGGPKIDPSLLRLDRTDLPIPRKGFATMQINDKMLDPNQEVESPYRRTSPSLAKTAVESDDRSAFSDDEDDFLFNETAKESASKEKSSTRQQASTYSHPPSHGNSHSHSHTAPSGSGPAAILKLDESSDGKRHNHHHPSSVDSRAITAPVAKHRPSSGGRQKLEPLNHSSKTPTTHSHSSHRDDDVKLPMFPFHPPGIEPPPTEGDANTNTASPSAEKKDSSPKEAAANTKASRATLNLGSAKRKKIRTDVNEKAKFIEPPTGKFRREFSRDHPLAAGGEGKYDNELKKGLLPTGLPLPSQTIK
eukprot:gene23788-30854_t